MAAIILPTFYYALKNSTPIIHLLIAMGILAFLTGFMNSTAQYLASSLFPAEIRFSGVAICQSLGMAFFAGLAPLYVSILTDYFNNLMIPAQILALTYVIQVFAIIIIIIFGKQLKVSTES